jgi:hypothetical protein
LSGRILEGSRSAARDRPPGDIEIRPSTQAGPSHFSVATERLVQTPARHTTLASRSGSYLPALPGLPHARYGGQRRVSTCRYDSRHGIHGQRLDSLVGTG